MGVSASIRSMYVDVMSSKKSGSRHTLCGVIYFFCHLDRQLIIHWELFLINFPEVPSDVPKESISSLVPERRHG